MASLDSTTTSINTRIEKEHKSKKEVKAQLQQYRQLLMEMVRPLDSRPEDSQPSTLALPQEEFKSLYAMRKVVVVKTWIGDQLRKVRMFLQDTMDTYEDAHLLEKGMIICTTLCQAQSIDVAKKV